MLKQLIVYIFRWQLSSIVLYPCLVLLSFSPLLATVVSNFIGALIFFPIDKYIFNKRKKGELNNDN